MPAGGGMLAGTAVAAHSWQDVRGGTLARSCWQGWPWWSAPRVTLSAVHFVVTARPCAADARFGQRLGQSTPVGNEGAGWWSGWCFANRLPRSCWAARWCDRWRHVRAVPHACGPVSAAASWHHSVEGDRASSTRLTALGMVETMRREGQYLCAHRSSQQPRPN
jgi:hypothetical protein